MSGLITLRRVVISVLLAGSLAALVWGLSQTRSAPGPVTYSDPAIRQLFPLPGDHVLRQDRVGVTLATPFTGVLVVNGAEIPEDQLERVAGLNQIFYTPGKGKEVETLFADRNCVTALIWRFDESRQQSHPFSWCFFAS
jgi:hypothetical protein